VSHQHNRTVVAERAVGNGRAEPREVLIAARPELADHDRLCEMLGRAPRSTLSRGGWIRRRLAAHDLPEPGSTLSTSHIN
jgi:hypothetical protein